MNSKLVGIEIGGTKLQLVVGDAAGHIAQRRKLTVDPSKAADGIRQQIAQTLPELLQLEGLKAIGIGFGGPVDWRSARIARSHQVEGWSGFDLAAWLKPITNLPVVADNDANVAALGESRCGAGQGCNPVFYVTLGSGVGGGLVVDGHIYHGAAPGESELGHLRLDREGTILESRCSGWAVDRKLRAYVAAAPSSAFSRLAGSSSGGESKHLASALAQGDPGAKRILDETAADLALGLSHVVHLFHPQAIVLGGGLSLVGEPLRAAVDAALRPLLMEVFRPGPQVTLAALGEDAVPVGALLMAAARVDPASAATPTLGPVEIPNLR